MLLSLSKHEVDADRPLHPSTGSGRRDFGLGRQSDPNPPAAVAPAMARAADPGDDD